MSVPPSVIQERLEAEVASFKQIQKDYTKVVNSRAQFISQQNENEMVQKELKLLEPDAAVFKLIGPVLVRQDLAEVKSNVDKRLQFIGKELERIEKTGKDLEKKQDEKKAKLMEMQQHLAAARAAAAGKK